MNSDQPDASPSPPKDGHVACVGLGSNQEPAANLAAALLHLRRELEVETVSSAWQSPSIGIDAPDFVNAAVMVRSVSDETDLVRRLKRIEETLGRIHGPGVTRIPIDLDLLGLDGRVRKLDLWDLPYRAVPVAELMPRLRHPESGELLGTAAARHRAAGRIWPRPDILLDANRPRTSRAGAAD